MKNRINFHEKKNYISYFSFIALAIFWDVLKSILDSDGGTDFYIFTMVLILIHFIPNYFFNLVKLEGSNFFVRKSLFSKAVCFKGIDISEIDYSKLNGEINAIVFSMKNGDRVELFCGFSVEKLDELMKFFKDKIP